MGRRPWRSSCTESAAPWQRAARGAGVAREDSRALGRGTCIVSTRVVGSSKTERTEPLMNRRELIRAVAARTAQDVRHVESVVSGVTDVITAVVSKGEPVTIQGFAKFAKVERAARMGRNPRTGEQIRIKASKRVRVSPMKAFKDTVMSPGQAPKLERGVWPTSPDLLTQQAAARRDAARPSTAAATKSTGTRKAAGAKKTTRKKAAATRATARKTTAKRATAKRPAAKKAVARKAPAKKTAARRAPAKKTVARKAPAKKTAAKKTTAKRAAAKRTARR
ncbi:MAG: HU family DNA-binding protein [Acidimicrobiales bacterium]